MSLIEDQKYPYSPKFQERLAAALLQDPSLYNRYYGIWSASHFTDLTVQTVMRQFFLFRETSKETPNPETLLNAVIVANSDKAEEFQRNLVSKIDELYNYEVVDKEFTEKHVVDWAKSGALEAAILQCADHLQRGKKERIKSIMDEAYRLGEDLSDVGLKINSGFTSPSKLILSEFTSAIPTGFNDLDPLMNGGVRGGELFVFIGPPKGFKSGNMLNATIPAMQAPFGKNVTYVSLELSPEKILARYAMRWTRIDKKTIEEKPEEFDAKFEQRIQQILTGQLLIKQYPTRTMTPSMLRSFLDLADTQGHTTDLLVVDYGNIMKPEDKYSSEWGGIGSNFEALRAIAVERDIPVITAARTNRESLSTDNVQMHHIAGSMEISAVCDYGVALIQTPEEHNNWKMRHKLLLNRNEDMGVVIGCDIDYSTYHICNTGVITDTEDEESEEDEKDRKEKNRKFARGDDGEEVITRTNQQIKGGRVSPEIIAKLKKGLGRTVIKTSGD